MSAVKARDHYKKELLLSQKAVNRYKKTEARWNEKQIEHQQKMASIELEKLKTKESMEKMKVSLIDKQVKADIDKKSLHAGQDWTRFTATEW